MRRFSGRIVNVLKKRRVVEQIIEEPEMLNINTFSEVTNVMEQKIYRFLEEKQKKTGIKLVEERYERFRRM